jgi:hypothetical protein
MTQATQLSVAGLQTASGGWQSLLSVATAQLTQVMAPDVDPGSASHDLVPAGQSASEVQPIMQVMVVASQYWPAGSLFT